MNLRFVHTFIPLQVRHFLRRALELDLREPEMAEMEMPLLRQKLKMPLGSH